MSTTDQPYAGAFKAWWDGHSNLFKTILVGSLAALVVLITIGVATGGEKTPEEEFLSNVDLTSQARDQYSDYELVSFGYEVCSLESYGYSGLYVNRIIADETGMSYADVGAINLTASATDLCHAYK
jgi:hypothetical protein